MRTSIMIAGLAALLVAGCDNPEGSAETEGSAQTETQAEGDAGDRAREALGEAGTAARETMQNIGEAGAAGIDALRQNAPEIQEGLNNAGERVRDAAGQVIEGVDGKDAAGDSQADPNETPEAAEPAQ